MRRFLIAPILILVLASCIEYTSSFPVGQEGEAAPYDHLLGDWIFYKHIGDTLDNRSDEFNPHGLRIMPFNSNEFLIEMIPVDDSIVTALEYVNDFHLIRGWLTNLAGRQFLNLNPIGEKSDDTLFLLHHVQVRDDTLISTTISERLFKELSVEINSVSDHAEFVKSVADKEELWNIEYRYLKGKD